MLNAAWLGFCATADAFEFVIVFLKTKPPSGI
jgi:hypothetical protein